MTTTNLLRAPARTAPATPAPRGAETPGLAPSASRPASFEDRPGDALLRALVVAALLGMVALSTWVAALALGAGASWASAAPGGATLGATLGGLLAGPVRVALAVWGVLAALGLAVQTLLWLRYRPFAPATPEEAPTLTVVIPAYNEGPMVARSIESVARARYPRGRLEVFVVDDGSRDDTWAHIERAAARFPDLVTTLRFPENRGKRAALEAGFLRARGEVLVTIDSDSVIDEGTLLAIAGPFRDPKVGAVAGKVAVHNREDGVIPKMLHVAFSLSFDFRRAAQSEYGTVYCCPGALTAYRASVVRDALPGWVDQHFLGARCAAGEDRALTNEVLARRHDTVYQRAAVVRTLVPTTHRQLCKMFLRWDRSYVREEARFARIVWRRPPAKLALALFDGLVRNLSLPVRYAALGLVVAACALEPLLLPAVALATAGGALVRMLWYVRQERSLDFVYGVLYAFYFVLGLSWIFPYAVVTVRARGWLTR